MSTADRRLLPGPEGPGGYRRLHPAPGEAHQTLTAQPVPPESKPLLVFIQLSDTHVMDSQSSARVESLDRYADPDLVPPGDPRTVGTYRPQELFTHHVLEAMVQAANAIIAGPVSGAPVDFAVVTGEIADLPCTRYGFPTAPHVLDATRRPFQATGLRMPWLSVYGGGAAISGAADPARRLVARGEHLAAHLASPGRPSGHGYTTENLVAETCYYAVDYGDRVRVIVLDTVNPHGGWQGSLDPAQLSWLRFQLSSAADRRVVLFSHHPLETMVNGHAPDGHRRVLGDELRQLLIEHPCVVLWVNGHTHRHHVSPACRADGEVGFWQVTTASHIDWPQQSRVVELLEAPDGTLTIASTVFDSTAPAQPPETGADPLALASLSRELSANDWQTREAIAGERGSGAGTPDDRNVVVTIPAATRQWGTSRPLPAGAIEFAEDLLALVDSMEELPYGGEMVSQRAHALQCATLAVGAGACDELVAAALLHDIGYTPWVQAAAPRRTHERAAAAFLLPRLGEHVGWLIGHHVAAKRYLVAVDDAYAATLSEASRRSLHAQDGPASAAEIDSWRTHRWWPEAVMLRSWDDRAKVPGAPTLPGSWFRNLLATLAAPHVTPE